MQWRCSHSYHEHPVLQATCRGWNVGACHNKRTRIVSTGIEVPTVKGFNTFRTWYNLYNKQCHVPDPPPVSATVFTDAQRNLGEFLSGKLDYELLKSGAGTDPVKVIKAIIQGGAHLMVWRRCRHWHGPADESQSRSTAHAWAPCDRERDAVRPATCL